MNLMLRLSAELYSHRDSPPITSCFIECDCGRKLALEAYVEVRCRHCGRVWMWTLENDKVKEQ